LSSGEKASQQPCAFNRGIHPCKGKRDAGVAASIGARGASATTCSQIFSARMENLQQQLLDMGVGVKYISVRSTLSKRFRKEDRKENDFIYSFILV